jgi:uncharacterized protein DUF2283
MTSPTLEITFRKGRPLAAYLHLSSVRRKAGATRELAPNVLGDFDKRGTLLGLEILAFDRATVARINDALVSCGYRALPAKELAPLRAA